MQPISKSTCASYQVQICFCCPFLTLNAWRFVLLNDKFQVLHNRKTLTLPLHFGTILNIAPP
jgi:hypothetical protein